MMGPIFIGVIFFQSRLVICVSLVVKGLKWFNTGFMIPNVNTEGRIWGILDGSEPRRDHPRDLIQFLRN